MSTTTLQQEYSEHFRLIGRIICRRIERHGLFGDRGDEAAANALGWSWVLFVRYRSKGDSARDAAGKAAVYGLQQVSTLGSPTPWGCKGGHNPPTALDRIVRRQGNPHWLLDIPEDLRQLAEILGSGSTQRDAADMLGVSPQTIGRRVEQLRSVMGGVR